MLDRQGKAIAGSIILLGLILVSGIGYLVVTGRLPVNGRGTGSRIYAARGWQPTGVRVQRGQLFTIAVAAGQWRDADDTLINTAGLDYVCGRADCCEPMPYERRSALIGRIGIFGTPFLIGEGGDFMAESGGIVYLRINDCDDGLYDNGGWIEFNVTIR